MPNRNFLLTSLLVLVIGYLLLNLLVRWAYPKQLFPYRGSSYEDSELLGRVTAEDGNEIVFIFRENPDPAAPILYYLHGNGQDLGHTLERLDWFQSLGYSVLALDYPGYGLSTGTPTAQSVRAATDAVWNYAKRTLGATSGQTVLWGHSLGGAPATYLATKEVFRGLVLESTFRSVLSLAPTVPLLLSEPFPTEDLIRNVEGPIHLFHGELDAIIPISHSLKLRNIAGENAVLTTIPDGTHNNLRSVAGPEMAAVLEKLRSSQ